MSLFYCYCIFSHFNHRHRHHHCDLLMMCSSLSSARLCGNSYISTKVSDDVGLSQIMKNDPEYKPLLADLNSKVLHKKVNERFIAHLFFLANSCINNWNYSRNSSFPTVSWLRVSWLCMYRMRTLT